jgi:ABC-type sugar transport system ATPase subunit
MDNNRFETESPHGAAPLLELRRITKAFPGVQALDGVSLELCAGEVHALMGENGAGKSTTVRILCGVYQPDDGQILLDGVPTQIANPRHAIALGISPVHQELHLQPFLTVAENIFLGRQQTGPLGLIDRKRMNLEANQLLADLGVEIEPTATVGSISIAERQVVSIARAVSMDARILIFDEPTSSLSDRETTLLVRMIERLRAKGIGIIYITHRMDEVFRLSDRITVFRDGRYVATTRAKDTTLRELVGMMIGREIGEAASRSRQSLGPPILEVRGVTRAGLLHDISLTIRAGEILGLAGLVGSGRTELARVIFGDLEFDSGELVVDGRRLSRGHNCREAIASGIGLVPEDRKEQGLVAGLSVQRNIGMPTMRALSRFGVLNVAAEKRLAQRFVEQLAIRTPSVDQKVMFLSGGNQQRVVIAKWISTRPKLLIVDEPTRGIDIGAKVEIHRLLADLAGQGMALLMISSELPEIIALSDRVLVMHRGRIAGELSGSASTQESIMHLATGQLAPTG